MKLVFTSFALSLSALMDGCRSVPELTPGMSVREVRKELHRDLLHQFTTLDHDAVVTCLLPETRTGYDNHYLIFHNGAFSHATMIPPLSTRWNDHDGRRIAQWRSQADSSERRKLVLSSAAVAQPFRRLDDDPREDESNGSVQPLFIMMLPLMPLHVTTLLVESLVDQDQPRFAKLELVRTGSTEAEVTASLGVPTKTVEVSETERIALFGAIPKRNEPSIPPFDCLAIRYVNRHVHDILSNDFIDESWWD